jgi:hypothetical protein
MGRLAMRRLIASVCCGGLASMLVTRAQSDSAFWMAFTAAFCAIGSARKAP